MGRLYEFVCDDCRTVESLERFGSDLAAEGAALFGAGRLVREWVGDGPRPTLNRRVGLSRKWCVDDSGAPLGRGDAGQSPRSRNNMRWTFASLPWEMLGDRLVMLSLTYPGDWRSW